MSKKVTLYERDGAVYRRVTEDLGGGQRSVISDSMLDPSVEDFLEREPQARVVRETDAGRITNPENYTLEALPSFLQTVESVDELLELRRRDGRKTADQMYLTRIEEVMDVEVTEVEDEEDMEEPEGIEDEE